MAAVAQVLNCMGTFLQNQHICDHSSWQTLERVAHLDKGCGSTVSVAESDLQFSQGLTDFINQLQDILETLQRDMGRCSVSRAGTPSTDDERWIISAAQQKAGGITLTIEQEAQVSTVATEHEARAITVATEHEAQAITVATEHEAQAIIVATEQGHDTAVETVGTTMATQKTDIKAVATEAESDGTNRIEEQEADGTTVVPDVKSDGTTVVPDVKSDGTTVVPEVKSDGTTVAPEVKSDGTTVVPEVKSDGTTVVPEVKSDGTTVVPEVKSDGTTVVPEVKSDGTTVVPEVKSDGTTVVPDLKSDGTTVVPDLKSDGTTVDRPEETEGRTIVADLKSEKTTTVPASQAGIQAMDIERTRQGSTTPAPLVITPRVEDGHDHSGSVTERVTSEIGLPSEIDKTDVRRSTVKVEPVEYKPPVLDPNQVQIRADKSEIDRRIAAFIQRKQNEVDVANRREFCNVLSEEQADNSCARTDAIFLPKPDSKSHFRVTRVLNRYGPQTRQRSPGTASHHQRAAASQSGLLDGLEERLHNIETHMKIKKGELDRKSVYERLKLLEERILHLESLSPEYFSTGVLPTSPIKRRRTEGNVVRDMTLSTPVKYESMTLPEIEDRIRSLKRSLRL